jgi:hypothetical protein
MCLNSRIGRLSMKGKQFDLRGFGKGCSKYTACGYGLQMGTQTDQDHLIGKLLRLRGINPIPSVPAVES